MNLERAPLRALSVVVMLQAFLTIGCLDRDIYPIYDTGTEDDATAEVEADSAATDASVDSSGEESGGDAAASDVDGSDAPDVQG